MAASIARRLTLRGTRANGICMHKAVMSLVQAVSDSNIPLECCYSYGQTRYKPEFSKISNFLTRPSSWSGFLISRFWQRKKKKKIYLTGVFVAGIFLVNNSSRNFVLLRNNLAIYTYSKKGGGGRGGGGESEKLLFSSTVASFSFLSRIVAIFPPIITI